MKMPSISMPSISMPTFSGIRSSVQETVSPIKNYSVSLELPTMRKSVAVAPVQSDSKVQKIFEGNIFKGLAAAVGTVLAGVVALGTFAALASNPIGWAVTALAVALFAIGSAMQVSYTPPALPVVEEVAPPAPAPRTWPGYFASFVGY